MPWTFQRYPVSMKHLSPIVREKAIEIANALLEEGHPEGQAIRIAIARAKKWAQRRGLVDTYAPLVWQSLVIATLAIVVARGVRHGIEAISKVLMPLLAILVIVLACYSMTLDATLRGVYFMLRPDWSALLKPDVYLAGLGQALFSLGIGMGALLTYGSYAKLPCPCSKCRSPLF